MIPYSNEWTSNVFNGMAPIYPTAASDALSFYQLAVQLLGALEEVRKNCDKLADYTNGELERIVEYLNNRLTDFNDSMNTFFKKIDKLVQDFMASETANREEFEREIRALIEQFMQEMLRRQEEFEAKIEGEIQAFEDKINGIVGDLQDEWNGIKQEWEAIKQAWEAMKQAFEQFKLDMQSTFEQFKQDMEQWKDETFQYFLGQYETIKQLVLEELPKWLEEHLPPELRKQLAQIAGLGMTYNQETGKLDLKIGAGLAFDGEGRVFYTGGGSGGTVVTPGQGIDVQTSGLTQTVLTKLAEGGGLSYDELGAIKMDNPSGGGGDTVAAGDGILILGSGTKTILTKIASRDNIGAVKAGDPEVTGIVIDTDGTIKLRRWTPVDITDDQEYFDQDMEPIGDTFIMDCAYAPNGKQFLVYVRLLSETKEQLGIPTNAQLIEWVPDIEGVTLGNPPIKIGTNGLILNSDFKVTIGETANNMRFRDGKGVLRISWTGKENLIDIPVKVIHANLIVNTDTPIQVGGTPIRNGDTVTYNDLQSKPVYVVTQDGTVVKNLEDIKTTLSSLLSIVANNNNVLLVGIDLPVLSTKNIIDGLVQLYYNPLQCGAGTENRKVQLIQFNVTYNELVWDALVLNSNVLDNTVDNFLGNMQVSVQFPNYSGSGLVVSSTLVETVAINNYNGNNVRVALGEQFTVRAGRFGSAQIQVGPDYRADIKKTIDVTVRDVNPKPHFKIMSNITLVGDESKDIGNPTDLQSVKLSKLQGLVTFWVQLDPMSEAYAYVLTDGILLFYLKLLSGETIKEFRTSERRVPVNAQCNYDFSNVEVGTKVVAEYAGNEFIPAYKIDIAEVVE